MNGCNGSDISSSAALAVADVRVQQLEAENKELMHKLANIASSLPVSGPGVGADIHHAIAENNRLKEQLISLNKLNKGMHHHLQYMKHSCNFRSESI